jgi:hypothetical protein
MGSPTRFGKSDLRPKGASAGRKAGGLGGCLCFRSGRRAGAACFGGGDTGCLVTQCPAAGFTFLGGRGASQMVIAARNRAMALITNSSPVATAVP